MIREALGEVANDPFSHLRQTGALDGAVDRVFELVLWHFV